MKGFITLMKKPVKLSEPSLFSGERDMVSTRAETGFRHGHNGLCFGSELRETVRERRGN